ncbi:MAG: class I tRNA ligase family protein, partial [Candidatus Poseidoniaceae archaeon]
AVSTTVFDSPAYKRCLSLGLILDAEGKKMSKSRGNIVDPWDHFNREGADATRWYMVTAGAPWNPLKFDSNGVRETYAKMFLTLWNVYRFHADYAALDAFDPASSTSSYESRSRLDRWILSKLHSTAKAYHDGFTNWNFHKACRELEDFIVNDLSNWYVRRSRRRLWDEAESGDKLACQHTLHEILVTLCRLIAPVSPFMVDTIHRNLTGETVHTAAWPLGTPGSTEGATADAWNVDLVAATQQLPPHDAELEHEMALVRELAETGRRIRIDAQRRQRLPCAEGWIVAGPNLEAYHDLLCEELNVESISVETDLDRFQQVELGVNFRALAPRAKGDVNAIADQIKNHPDQDALLADIRNGSCTIMGVDILESDVEVRRAEREGYAAATITVGEGDTASHVSLVLDMQDTPHLLSKGLARDITRRIQSKRKDMDLEIESMIDVEVWMTDAPELFEEDQAWVAKETRASGIAFSEDQAPADAESFDVDGAQVSYRVKKV